MPLIVPIYILKYKKMTTFFFLHVEGSVACQQQMHFRSSLLSLRRSDDRKCVCCLQAKGSEVIIKVEA